MDGTLVDSTAGVVGAWEVFKEKYPNIDVQNILSSSHGVRTVENLKKYCGVEDPAEQEREAQRFEEAIVTSSKANGRKGIVMLPGVSDAMKELEPLRHLPKPKWALCTSATRSYAAAALSLAGVPVPDVFVAAEDVSKGKPAPDPYLLGAQRCGVNPAKCVVFEDAPAGTIGFLTTHSLEQMTASEPDFIVSNMTSIKFRITEAGLEITIRAD
ncbi:phosphatase [Dendrothele bispora CBS 962.96]|uniref:Phosphatase n=1 Tax=Dendrothele bispora (strain CBS 962.96) TaxID=1314807 RepID=A0A4S8MYV0_DENBC|nr:phosphatase [Dendrothele bispora CBS 962.96]